MGVKQKLLCQGKGVFRHAEFPRDIKKNADLKIWPFLLKALDLPLGKKIDFWTKYKYSFKSFQSSQCGWKRPLRHVFGLSREHGQRKSPQKIRLGWDIKRYFFFRPLFELKNDSQRSFRHAEFPRDIYKWKFPTSKFGHLWPKSLDLPLGKSRFLDEIQILF